MSASDISELNHKARGARRASCLHQIHHEARVIQVVCVIPMVTTMETVMFRSICGVAIVTMTSIVVHFKNFCNI